MNQKINQLIPSFIPEFIYIALCDDGNLYGMTYFNDEKTVYLQLIELDFLGEFSE